MSYKTKLETTQPFLHNTGKVTTVVKTDSGDIVYYRNKILKH